MKCHICNKPISGRYYIDGWGHSVCAEHILNEEIVQCSSCTGFTDKINLIPDGRILCSECHLNSVEDYKVVNTIFNFVINSLNNVGFSDLRTEDIEIKIVSAEFMANIKKGAIDTNNKGLTQSKVTSSISLLGGCQKKMQHTIYMLSHQTEVEFAGTLAHELLHAWQVQNNITPPPKYCEGFCNLATYYVLSNIKEPIAEILINNLKQNPDPIYGDGFREVLNWFQQTNWKYLINKYKDNNFTININLKKGTIMVNEKRFAGESAQNFEQKCMCVLVLDASGSMRGDKLTSLNNGIKDFFTQIQNSEGVAEGTKDQLEVAIIQYDEDVKILRDPQLIEIEESAPEVTERGSTTNTVDALKEAIQLVEDRKAFYKSTGQTYYRPWIILMTDGEPYGCTQADIDAISAQVAADNAAKKYMVMGIGVGDDADMAQLKTMTGKAEKLAGLKFGAFFQWLSASMSTITQSKSGAKVDLSQGASDWMSGYDI